MKAFINQLITFICLLLLAPTLYSATKLSETGPYGTLSTQSLAPKEFTIGIQSNLSVDGSFIKEIPLDNLNRGNTKSNSPLLANQNLGVNLGVLPYFNIGVAFPFYFLDSPGILFIGDLTYQAKYSLGAQIKLPESIQIALLGGGTLPLSQKNAEYAPRAIDYPTQVSHQSSRDYSSTGTGVYDIHYGFAVNAEVARWTKEASLALQFNLQSRNPGLLQTSQHFNILHWYAGLSAQPHQKLVFYGGYLREVRLQEQYSSRSEVSQLQLSFETLTTGFNLYGGVQLGILNYGNIPVQAKQSTFFIKGSPDYAFNFGFTWSGILQSNDLDHDGIINSFDACPRKAEDRDQFEDSDGCPEWDNDGDQIADTQDKCPLVPEDKDKFEDTDGCPELDNDRDGLPDKDDKCPNKYEDYDQFQDEDGCPDYDNDGDKIVDILDKCPNQAEDFDEFEDLDGCPELDNDQDRIADAQDKCPNQAETVNGFLDKDGCPDEQPYKKLSSLSREILFATGTANLMATSQSNLDSVVHLLHQYPKLTLKVAGHTDNIASKKYNQILSQKRAESVFSYLKKMGIQKDKLMVEGFGSSKPIGDNKTATGRALNRRVELIPLP